MELEKQRQWVKENLVGRDPMVDRVFDSIAEGLALTPRRSVVGAYLFVGPASTSKTYFPHLAGQALYPGHEPVSLGMQQYRSPHDVSTLVGSARLPLHEGDLTRSVLSRPPCALIFDNVDRADPAVHRRLAEIIRAGGYEDASTGRKVDLRNYVVFASTCRGLEEVQAAITGVDDPAARSERARHALVGLIDEQLMAAWTLVEPTQPLAPAQDFEIALRRLRAQWKDHGVEIVHAESSSLWELVQRRSGGSANFLPWVRHEFGREAFGLIRKEQLAGATRVRLDLTSEGELRIERTTE